MSVSRLGLMARTSCSVAALGAIVALAPGARGSDEIIVAPTTDFDAASVQATARVMSHVEARPALIGQPQGGIAGAGTGVVCADTVTGCNLPNQAGNGSGGIVGATSDAAAGFAVLERVTSDVGATITTLCWWGSYLDFDVPTDCGGTDGVPDPTPPADSFSITIFQNTAGCPASEPNFALGTAPQTPVVTRAATGNVIPSGAGDLVEYEYTATLTTPIPLPPGGCAWIQIQNDTTTTPEPSCFWLWSTAAPGDGLSWQTEANDYDMAICVGFDQGAVTNCQLAINPLCPGDGGNCYEANGSAGCDDECCCTLVCQTNAFCCNVQWDEGCATQGIDLGCTALPPAPLCDTDGTIPEPGSSSSECQIYDVLNAFNSTTDPSAGFDLFLAADDFTVTADGTITDICFYGVYGTAPVTDNFTVQIFAGDATGDDAGMPGTLLSTDGPSLAVTRSETNQGIDLGGGVVLPIFRYDATLAGTAVTAGECYWLQVTNGIADQGESWFWEWSRLGRLPGDGLTASDPKEGNGRFIIDGDGGTTAPDGYTFFDQGTTQDFAWCLQGHDLATACGFDARYDTGVHDVVLFNGAGTNLGWSSGDLDVGPGVDDQRRTSQAFTLPALPVGTANAWSVEHLLIEGFDPAGGVINESINFEIHEFTALDVPPTPDSLIVEFNIDTPDGVGFDAATTETGALISGFGLEPGTYWLIFYAANTDPDTFASNVAWFTNAPDGINNVCTGTMPPPAPGFEGCTPNDPTGDPPGSPAMLRARTYPVPGLGAYTLDPSVLDVDPATDPDPNPADLYNAAFRMRGRAVTLSDCPYDCGDGNLTVDTIDFLALLGQWGNVGSSCDAAGDGVDTIDFLGLLGAWGPCP